MKISKIPIGINATNCYIISFDNKKAIIIDPGDEGEKICRYTKNEGLIPQGIILTHGHFDHIGAAGFLREEFNIPVSIHKLDAKYLIDPSKNLSLYFKDEIKIKPADNILEENNKIFNFELIHTPGHTPGGISLYNEKEKILFTGDTIFKNSYGRTDFPEGNEKTLFDSIKKLLNLSDDIVVYPGHGEKTSIGEFRVFFQNINN